MRGTITITPASYSDSSWLLAGLFWILGTASLFGAVHRMAQFDTRSWAIGLVVWAALALGGGWVIKKLFYRFHPELNKEPQKARASYSLNGLDGHIYVGPADMVRHPDGKIVVSIDLSGLERPQGITVG